MIPALLPATWLAVFCFSACAAFLGFVAGLLVMLPRLHRVARVAYLSGALDAYAGEVRGIEAVPSVIRATYSEARPAGLRVVRE